MFNARAQESSKGVEHCQLSTDGKHAIYIAAIIAVSLYCACVTYGITHTTCTEGSRNKSRQCYDQSGQNPATSAD